MKTKLIAIASVLTLACSPKIQLPSEDKLPPTEIPMSPELVEGKTLFLNNCSKCPPDDISKLTTTFKVVPLALF